jgi:hypothetical protein
MIELFFVAVDYSSAIPIRIRAEPNGPRDG